MPDDAATTAALLETAAWAVESLAILLKHPSLAVKVIGAVGDAGIAQALMDSLVALALPTEAVTSAFPALATAVDISIPGAC